MTKAKNKNKSKKPTKSGTPARRKTKAGDPAKIAKAQAAKLPRLNTEVLERAAKHYTIILSGTPDQRAQQVAGHMKPILDAIPEKEQYECSACGMVALDETQGGTPYCPFCGHTGDSIPAEPVPNSAPLEKAQTGTMAPAEEFRYRMGRISELRRDMTGNAYDLGIELREIHTKQLWRGAKFKRDGKEVACESFKDFYEGVLNASKPTVYQLMEVAEKFSRAQYQELGQTKLAILASVNDEGERKQLMEDARAGESARSIKRKAEAAKTRTGQKSTSPSKSKAATAAESRDAVKPAGESRGRPSASDQTITLLAKVNGSPKTVNWRNAKSRREVEFYKPGETLAIVPVAEGVEMHVTNKHDRSGKIIGLTYVFVRHG